MSDEKHETSPDATPAVASQEEHMSAGRYIATRLPTLKPPMEKVANPFKLMVSLGEARMRIVLT